MELCVSKNKNINSKIFYLVFGYFSTNTSRAFGARKLVESDLQLMSKVCLFLNGVFRISWGFVYDRFGFKIPYTIITALQIITSISQRKNIYTLLDRLSILLNIPNDLNSEENKSQTNVYDIIEMNKN